MTNYEKIKSLGVNDLAMMLAYFCDHGSMYVSECDGCPISNSGCCGYPESPCNDSCIRWLNSECDENAEWWKYRP